MAGEVPQLTPQPDVDTSVPQHPDQPAVIKPGEVTKGFSVEVGDPINAQRRAPMSTGGPEKPKDPPEETYSDPTEQGLAPLPEDLEALRHNPNIFPTKEPGAPDQQPSPEVKLPPELS